MKRDTLSRALVELAALLAAADAGLGVVALDCSLETTTAASLSQARGHVGRLEVAARRVERRLVGVACLRGLGDHRRREPSREEVGSSELLLDWLGVTSVTRPAVATARRAYLPREVFFGRLGLAGAFFSVLASDFMRFFPATLNSFH